jgi:hypothetical protein
MGISEDNRYYIVKGYWNPLARTFKDLSLLNEETPKGKFDCCTSVSLTFQVLVYF